MADKICVGVETEGRVGGLGISSPYTHVLLGPNHQSLLAGQGEGRGPGPVLFRWLGSVLGFPVCSLGSLNSPPFI